MHVIRDGLVGINLVLEVAVLFSEVGNLLVLVVDVLLLLVKLLLGFVVLLGEVGNLGL